MEQLSGEIADQPYYQLRSHAQRSLPPKVVSETKEALRRQAVRMAKHADEHAQFINKIMYLCGVLSFGTFCFLLGSRPQDIPLLYCLFFIVVVPLRWIYYRSKKWHYYLLDFCYYANVIFMTMLLFYPNNEKLFMVCFSFSEGPLAWALIIWRCSLVFNSLDKIVSVLIHLLPGTVFFIIRWWDPTTFSHHPADDMGPWPAWPVEKNLMADWTWLFLIPLLVYCVWQALYFLIVEGLRRQRLLDDPEVMTSYRELKRKAERANNVWWRLSGLLDHIGCIHCLRSSSFQRQYGMGATTCLMSCLGRWLLQKGRGVEELASMLQVASFSGVCKNLKGCGNLNPRPLLQAE
ncbi:hypothetical protein GOP47_0017973 [Adiantum capillus-veneris]|uniref:Glycerophosphocholine acyltransferase 1 n=1 Tax=Adiantum capillus-veneris TaxID=13818 RepID=A0A9D4UGG7_ADICA|nr:hypothetical protein GOP47_0017973 [Adiantum capillus-veneris]